MDDLSIQITKAIKLKVQGLPSSCRLVVYELLEYLDIKQACIKLDKTLSQIAVEDFHVVLAPGRKIEKTTPDTLRNTFRTIKKFKGEHFKFSVVNQRIEIYMPFIKELYEKHVAAQKVAGDLIANVAGASTHGAINEKGDFDRQSLAEDFTENAAVTSALLNKHNKHNKQTNTACLSEFERHKKPIGNDFYPSEKTIEQAMTRGLFKVIEAEEIAKFITFNQANKTAWVDYNPVFINWLEREEKHQSKHKKQQESTRSVSNDCSPYKNQSSTTLLDEIIRRHGNALAPGGCEEYTEENGGFWPTPQPAPHCLALDSVNQSIHEFVYR